MTERQEKILEYNNNTLARYKNNFLEVKRWKEKNEYKKIMMRRKEMRKRADEKVKLEPKKIHLYNRKIILESEVTEKIECENIEFWFNFNKE